MTKAQDMADAPRANIAVAEQPQPSTPHVAAASPHTAPSSPATPPTPSAPTPTPSPAAPAEASWDTEIEGQLTIDVYQTDNSIVIKSTIAGVTAEDLDISIDNDMVTIEGQRQNCDEVAQENYYYQECYWGGFSRSVILPCDVRADESEAELKNGILTIILPKASVKKAKKIMVKG